MDYNTDACRNTNSLVMYYSFSSGCTTFSDRYEMRWDLRVRWMDWSLFLLKPSLNLVNYMIKSDSFFFFYVWWIWILIQLELRGSKRSSRRQMKFATLSTSSSLANKRQVSSLSLSHSFHFVTDTNRGSVCRKQLIPCSCPPLRSAMFRPSTFSHNLLTTTLINSKTPGHLPNQHHRYPYALVKTIQLLFF